jgi:hypothetical protein
VFGIETVGEADADDATPLHHGQFGEPKEESALVRNCPAKCIWLTAA